MIHVDESNHQWVKVALRKRGSSFSQIARELGVAPATVCLVSRGTHRSRRIEAAIAGVIGYAPAELWPRRYAGQASAKEGEDSDLVGLNAAA